VLRRPRKLGLPGPAAGLSCSPEAEAARRRLSDGGQFPAFLLPEEGAGFSEGSQMRFRILDAWIRTCLDAPAVSAPAPDGFPAVVS
jgi:hypothetical protein